VKILRDGTKLKGILDGEGYLQEGSLTFQNGIIHQGKFEKGALIEGTIFFPNGNKHVGIFKDGVLERGTKYEDGRISKGNV
jgi:hypothetical protein